MAKKLAVHLADIRMRNNAGMDFPLCYADAPLLDMDKGMLETVTDFTKVTCKKCQKKAPVRYPWASYGKERK